MAQHMLQYAAVVQTAQPTRVVLLRRQVRQRCHVKREIGSGSYGTVYEVHSGIPARASPFGSGTH